jgi:hypothetical protein
MRMQQSVLEQGFFSVRSEKYAKLLTKLVNFFVWKL